MSNVSFTEPVERIDWTYWKEIRENVSVKVCGYIQKAADNIWKAFVYDGETKIAFMFFQNYDLDTVKKHIEDKDAEKFLKMYCQAN